MRKIILGVAVSLDGFIEGPKGEYDWCFTDQDYGLSQFFKRIDALLMGRKTFEMSNGGGEEAMAPFRKLRKYIVSSTLQQVPAGFDLIQGDVVTKILQLKSSPGKDIWLFGGASLTTSLMNEHLVDELWLSIHPLLLGGGKPLFQQIKQRILLELQSEKIYETGLIQVVYTINHER